jgi:site-specific DNA-cytosine methylase
VRVLVACEYSGRVREAFRNLGHDAWSCDLKPAEDGSEFHFQKDAIAVATQYPWDLLIAHPPCTHLAVSGARWFKDKHSLQLDALSFVRTLMGCGIDKICIENPVSIISSRIRKPDQIIQPWMFGDPFQKTTCLWLKNLPKLIPTNVVDKGEFVIHGGRKLPKWYSNREFARDKTFQGIADAMATQWGKT